MGKAEERDWMAEFGLLQEGIKIRLMEMMLCQPLFLLYQKSANAFCVCWRKRSAIGVKA